MKKESVLLGSWKVKENESGEGNKRQKWMGEYSQVHCTNAWKCQNETS
jgi:hypothetical protein